MEAVATTSVSQKPGKGPVRRVAQQNAVRVGAGTGSGAASVGIGRFRPLKPQGKLGVNIYSKLEILNSSALGAKAKNIREIYDDLLPCYNRYHELYHGHKPDMDLLAVSDGSAAYAVQRLLTMMNTMLGESISYTIEQDSQDKFYIMAYSEANYREQWNIIQVGPTLAKLKRYYPAMLTQFIKFLAALSAVGVEFWWEGHYGYHTSEYLEQNLRDNEDCDLPDEYTTMIKGQIKKYASGTAYQYQKMILAVKNESQWLDPNYIDDLLESLKPIKRCGRLKKLIRAGVKVIQTGKSIEDYAWRPNAGDYYDEGLHYADTNHIVFDANDYVQESFQEWLDVEAGEGLHPPYQRYAINEYTQSLFKQDNWPIMLNDFFDLACEEIHRFIQPKKKRNGPVK